MRIFVYAMREYDELKYFKKFQKQYGFEFGYTTEYPSMDNAELARGYDAISIITNPMYPEIMDKFYALGVRYIATRSIGYEHIDTKYAAKIGMRATHVTYSPNSVANYTIMMMLMACRNVNYILDKAALQDFSLEGKMGKELSTSTVGVIGTGNIGATVIKHLSSFGCKILAYDLYPKDEIKQYATYTDLDTLYRNSDIITLHVPGMESNYHMINSDTIEKMKDGVIIVNAARGLLIDTEALITGLESGKVGYAALDTFEHEKGLYYLNLEHEILKNRDLAMLNAMPNVMLSPHMAFYTDQAVSDMALNSIRGLLLLETDEDNPWEVRYE